MNDNKKTNKITGQVANREYYGLTCGFESLAYGKAYPTDIDASMDFYFGKLGFKFECKHRVTSPWASIKGGQRFHLEWDCEDHKAPVYGFLVETADCMDEDGKGFQIGKARACWLYVPSASPFCLAETGLEKKKWNNITDWGMNTKEALERVLTLHKALGRS